MWNLSWISVLKNPVLNSYQFRLPLMKLGMCWSPTCLTKNIIYTKLHAWKGFCFFSYVSHEIILHLLQFCSFPSRIFRHFQTKEASHSWMLQKEKKETKLGHSSRIIWMKLRFLRGSWKSQSACEFCYYVWKRERFHSNSCMLFIQELMVLYFKYWEFLSPPPSTNIFIREVN